MTTQQIKDALKEQLKNANKVVDEQIHHYSLAEMRKDIIKTAVVTSTALFTIILACSTGGE